MLFNTTKKLYYLNKSLQKLYVYLTLIKNSLMNSINCEIIEIQQVQKDFSITIYWICGYRA